VCVGFRSHAERGLSSPPRPPLFLPLVLYVLPSSSESLGPAARFASLTCERIRVALSPTKSEVSHLFSSLTVPEKGLTLPSIRKRVDPPLTACNAKLRFGPSAQDDLLLKVDTEALTRMSTHDLVFSMFKEEYTNGSLREISQWAESELCTSLESPAPFSFYPCEIRSFLRPLERRRVSSPSFPLSIHSHNPGTRISKRG